MVAGTYNRNEIVYFKDVKIGQSFASTKIDANFIKVNNMFGQKMNSEEVKYFEGKELVYIGTIIQGNALF